MDRKKSSLVFGFRTGRNILKGKNIRQSDDGAHNFDDYWTDSSSGGDNESVSQTQQSPSVSDSKLATLRQSVRKSEHSKTGISDRLDRSELTKSPLRSVNRNLLSKDQNIIRSPTKILRLSRRRQQSTEDCATRNLSHKSTVTDNLGSHDEVEYSARHSTSNETDRDEVVSRIGTQSKVDREERVQSRTLRHSVRDQSTSCPILDNSHERGKETPEKGRGIRNLNASLNFLQNSTCDASVASKYSENTVSPLSKKSNKVEETFAVQKNIPDANPDNSDIRELFKSKSVYNVLVLDDGVVPEMNPLADRAFIDRCMAEGVRERDSNALASTFGNHTVRKLENSLERSKKFAMYDEYDSAILRMIRQNEQNSRTSETLFSGANNLVKEKKTKSVTSKKPIQSTKESDDQIALERQMNSEKSQNFHNVGSSTKVQTRSQLKSSEFGDGSMKESSRKSTTEKKNFEVLNISLNSQHSRQSQTEHDLSSDFEQILESSSKVDKNGQLRAEKRSLRNKSSALESPSKRKSTVMPITSSEQRLNISVETSPKPVWESGTEKGNSEASNISLTSQRSLRSQTKQLPPGSKQTTESSSKVDKKGQLTAEERSLRSNSSVLESPSKKKSTTMPITSSEKRLNISVETSPKPVWESGLEKGNSEAVNISLTSQRSLRSQTKQLPSGSKQTIESSSKVDKKGQLRAEERSLHSNSTALESPSKKKSTTMPITTSEKRLNISVETSPKPVSESGTEKGNSEAVNISLTSQHSHRSQTERQLPWGSKQTIESSSKVDKKVQLTAEERSLRSKSSAFKTPSKRKSTAMSIPSSKKRSTEHKNMQRSRLNISGETLPKPVDESDHEADKMYDELLDVDSRALVGETSKELKAPETFVKDNSRRAIDIPKVGDKTISRQKHLTKSKETVKTPEYLSKDKINSASKNLRVKNKTTPSLKNKKKKRVNEGDENMPEIRDSGELELSPEKKKEKKTASPSVPLRRSSRQKFPRLAGWRHERLKFRVENGIINFVGIDSGIAEDDAAIRQMFNRIRPTHKELKKKMMKQIEFKLDDCIMQREVCVPVVKKFHFTPWDKEYRRDECPYRIKKLFQSCNSSCGFVQIEIDEEKPVQYMPDDDINMTVMTGKVQVTVQNNNFVAEEKDMFMVPRCIPYSLRNVGSKKALLVFCVGKFQYLESQV